MRTILTTIALVVLTAVAGVVFLWPAERSGVETIVYGRDACAHCRMRISDAGFAAELRDADGNLTKYDDVGCMLHAMVALHAEVPEAWVEDHDGGGFVPLVAATLVRAERVQTPMGSHIVAFRDAASARSFATAQGGDALSLEDVLRHPEWLERRVADGTTTHEVGS